MPKVYSVWLPYEDNKVTHFENEASVLDSRSDLCICFGGQKVYKPSLYLGHLSVQ